MRIPVLSTRRELAFDVPAVLVPLALGLGMAADAPGAGAPARAALVVVLAASALALAFRRRAPLTVAWITVAAGALPPAVELLSDGTPFHLAATFMLWWSPAAPFAAAWAMCHSPRL